MCSTNHPVDWLTGINILYEGSCFPRSGSILIDQCTDWRSSVYNPYQRGVMVFAQDLCMSLTFTFLCFNSLAVSYFSFTGSYQGNMKLELPPCGCIPPVKPTSWQLTCVSRLLQYTVCRKYLEVIE